MIEMYHNAFLLISLYVEEGENGRIISESPLPATVQDEPGIKLIYQCIWPFTHYTP